MTSLGLIFASCEVGDKPDCQPNGGGPQCSLDRYADFKYGVTSSRPACAGAGGHGGLPLFLNKWETRCCGFPAR